MENKVSVEQKCASCRHFDRAEEGMSSGACCRHAPVVESVSESHMFDEKVIYAIWPTVTCSCFCGEWAATNKAENEMLRKIIEIERARQENL